MSDVTVLLLVMDVCRVATHVSFPCLVTSGLIFTDLLLQYSDSTQRSQKSPSPKRGIGKGWKRERGQGRVRSRHLIPWSAPRKTRSSKTCPETISVRRAGPSSTLGREKSAHADDPLEPRTMHSSSLARRRTLLKLSAPKVEIAVHTDVTPCGLLMRGRAQIPHNARKQATHGVPEPTGDR